MKGGFRCDFTPDTNYFTNPNGTITRLTNALEVLPKALDPSAIYFYRATAYLNKGNQDLAIKDYNKAIELNPKYAKAFSNRGNAYGEIGKRDLAIKIELNPKLSQAFYTRGNAYSKIGNQDLAIKDYNKAIELNPKYAEAFYNRGVAYNKKGDKDRAISDYGQALKINPRLLGPQR